MENSCVFIWFHNIWHIKLHVLQKMYHSNDFYKGNTIKEMKRSLYNCGFLFRSNIIIDNIMVLLYFMQSYHYWSFWFTHHIKWTSWNKLTKFYVKDDLCCKFKQAYIVGHIFHQYSLLIICFTYKTLIDDMFQMKKICSW